MIPACLLGLALSLLCQRELEAAALRREEEEADAAARAQQQQMMTLMQAHAFGGGPMMGGGHGAVAASAGGGGGGGLEALGEAGTLDASRAPLSPPSLRLPPLPSQPRPPTPPLLPLTRHCFASPHPTRPDRAPAGGWLGQQVATLRLLSSLPQDSELYRLQMEHLTSLARLHMQRERLEQEQRVQQLQSSSREEEERRRREEEHALWVEQQKREVVERRLRLQLAREEAKVAAAAAGTSAAAAQQYDPGAGFLLYIDYCTTISRRASHAHVVYTFAEATLGPGGATAALDAVTEPRRTARRECVRAGFSSMCVLGVRKKVRAPATSRARRGAGGGQAGSPQRRGSRCLSLHRRALRRAAPLARSRPLPP